MTLPWLQRVRESHYDYRRGGTIPKPIREAMRLKPGNKVLIELEYGRASLTPLPKGRNRKNPPSLSTAELMKLLGTNDGQ